MTTKSRVLQVAMESFGARGYDGTSLDAVAAQLGLAKQTVLYHYPSKELLFSASVDSAADELAAMAERALDSAGPGWARIDALVREIFGLTVRRPEILGLIREVSRPDSPSADRLRARLHPLVERACVFLAAEIDAGRFRPADPELLLLSIYSTVLGVATEVEVARTIGIEPTLRTAAIRRNELLRFLRAAVLVG